RKFRRSRSARGDLLNDIDAVSAAEYDGVNPARPARELLSRLTENQAMAWIVARLAEALDHAFGRKVAHGDVKPSNILLTADGNPMLLDFNLAQDWSPSGSHADARRSRGNSRVAEAAGSFRLRLTSMSGFPRSWLNVRWPCDHRHLRPLQTGLARHNTSIVTR